MANCLKRSFEAGLRWCGINDRVPNMQMSGEAEKFAAKYGLQYIENGIFKSSDDPVLIIYADGKTATDAMYHAVFASDSAPFAKWDIYAAVIGWPELRNKTKISHTKKQKEIRIENSQIGVK